MGLARQGSGSSRVPTPPHVTPPLLGVCTSQVWEPHDGSVYEVLLLSHFTVGESETQRGKVIFPRSHSRQGQNRPMCPGCLTTKPRLPNLPSTALTKPPPQQGEDSGRRERPVRHALSHCSRWWPQWGDPHLADKGGKRGLSLVSREGAPVEARAPGGGRVTETGRAGSRARRPQVSF